MRNEIHRHYDPAPSKWLELARSQAKAAVEKELLSITPFKWPAKRQRFGFSLLLPAALMAVLLMASVTWALIAQTKNAAPRKAEVRLPHAVKALRNSGPQPTKRSPKRLLGVEASQLDLHEKNVAAAKPRRRRAKPEPVAEGLRPSLAPRGGIVHLDERNGSVIIVSPPAKLPPLITPESYINKRH